ncbi:uncharacterized protein [Littorina saxatilis]|uniref:GH10 domain-containing protein n=1 Tax=Littorina saxatilis TaxID=31220 RepID=A0AAN9GER6_9CAEN
MTLSVAHCLLLVLVALTRGELIQNGGMESPDHWECWGFQCQTTTDRHSGSHALRTSGRTQYFMGPSQIVPVKTGHIYTFSAWVKLLNDHDGQSLEVEAAYTYPGNVIEYKSIATRNNAKTSDGWIHLQGSFVVPRTLTNMRVYFQSGPSTSANFAVDDVSLTEVTNHVTTSSLNGVIDKVRKSDIKLHVTTASGINKADLKIRVVQTKKSFPFGTAVNAGKYNSNAGGGKYRDFIHKHFNWAVPENALKWPVIETQRGHKNYQPALDMIHGLKSHGIKVRGHNLVWSVPIRVQGWLKALSGNELRTEVKQHIEETMTKTRGLLEHWDVNNENLHGTWYQDTLHDPDYDLELFREAHHADPNVKLFLNDYSVVAIEASTHDYLVQGQRFKAANVGLYGMGVQCHFGNEVDPDATLIKQRLDILAQVGVPIWVTELDVMSADENRRADFYEHALRALYGHPAVEGILMWGFWDQSHWRGEKAALVKGNDLQLTAAGRRVLDLYENEWMTDMTHVVSQGDTWTVRGFHGDYEVHVIYQGRELSSLKQTFTLGKGSHAVNINVHT